MRPYFGGGFIDHPRSRPGLIKLLLSDILSPYSCPCLRSEPSGVWAVCELTLQDYNVDLSSPGGVFLLQLGTLHLKSNSPRRNKRIFSVLLLGLAE